MKTMLTAAAAAALFTSAAQAGLPANTTLGRTMDVEFADLDGDGNPDAVLAAEASANQILFGRDDGTFEQAATRTLPLRGYDSEDIAIADFDGDDRPDIVFVSEDTFVNELFLNAGGRRFTDVSERIPVNGRSNAVAAADVDRDGDVDLVIGNAGQNVLLLNDGNAHFEDATAQWLPSIDDTTQDLEFGDIDGDGVDELLVGNEDQNRLLRRDGDRFVDATAATLGALPSYEETREADFGDVDGDGDLDIVFANVGFQIQSLVENRLLINDGSGRFTDETAERLPSAPALSVDIDFHDLDADGDLDIVRGASFSSGTAVFRNDGSGRFSPWPEIVPEAALALDVIDVEYVPGSDSRFYLTNFQGEDVIVKLGGAPLGAAVSGLWFDPALDGEGYNVLLSPSGLVVYYYGYDAAGERLWLVSETAPGAPAAEVLVDLEMFAFTGGTFDAPLGGVDARESWGSLMLSFAADCATAAFTLAGNDGSKTADAVRLAGINGAECG